MSLQYDAYLHKLNLVYDIYKLDNNIKNLILLKYDMLCTSIASSTQDELIKPDIVEYGVICCKTVVKQMFLSKDIFDPSNCTLESLLRLYNKLNTGNINETVDAIYTTFRKKIESLGGIVTSLQSLDELSMALETIGISKIDDYSDEDYMDASQIIGLDAEDSALINSIFSSEEDDEQIESLDYTEDQEDYINDGFGDFMGVGGIEEDITNKEPEEQSEHEQDTTEETEEHEEPDEHKNYNETETTEDTQDTPDISVEQNTENEQDELTYEDDEDIDISLDDLGDLLGTEDNTNELLEDIGTTSDINLDDILVTSEDDSFDIESLIGNIDISDDEDDYDISIEPIGTEEPDKTETEENTESETTEQEETEQPEQEEQKKNPVDIRLSREIPVMTILKCISNNTWENPEETIKNYLLDYKYIELAFKNDFDYSSEMARDYETGLGKAIRVYGTLHYINSIGLLDNNRLSNLRNKLSERIVNESNKRVSALALGILIAYDNGDMPYDKLPNQAMLNRLAKVAYATTSERLIKKKEFKLEGELARLIDTYGVGGDPTVYRENSLMAYDVSNYSESKLDRKTFEKLDSGAIVLKPYKTQTVMAMKPEFATVVMPYGSTKDRLKLLYSRNGAKFLFEATWNIVLDTMSQSAGGDEKVQRVAIAGTEIIVNSSKVFLDNLYDSKTGVELKNIADLEKLLTRFNGIKQLVVEASLISLLVRKHIVETPNLHERILNVLDNIFNLNTSLYRLGIIDTCGSINEPIWYYRNGLEESSDTIIKQLRFESIKPDIEAVCAMSSPLLHMKSRSYIHRFFDTTMSDSSTAGYILSKLRDQDMSIKAMYSKSKSASVTKFIGNTKRSVKGITNIVKKKGQT